MHYKIKTAIVILLSAFAMTLPHVSVADPVELSCEAHTQFCLLGERGPTSCDPQKKTLHRLSVSDSSVENIDDYGFLTFVGSCTSDEKGIECFEHEKDGRTDTRRILALSRITGEGHLDIRVRTSPTTGRSMSGSFFCQKADSSRLF